MKRPAIGARVSAVLERMDDEFQEGPARRILVEGRVPVEDPLAAPLVLDESRAAQDGEVLAHGGLREPQHRHQLADAQGILAQKVQNSQAVRVARRFQRRFQFSNPGIPALRSNRRIAI